MKLQSFLYKNKISLVGLILLFLGVFILKYGSLDIYIRPFTQVFLMGSSEGKDVLFFFLMGSMLLLSPLFGSEGFLRRKLSYFNYFKDWKGNDFLKIVIIIVIFTYIIGIILEIWLRMQFGVSMLTSFVSLIPSPTSSSILHSHVFKAVVGPCVSSMVMIPTGVHTGTSLLDYVPPIGFLIVLVFPLVYILGLFSIGERRDYHKVIVIFAISTTLIGLIDGGLFSTPAMVGLSGILGMYSLKMPFSPRNLITPTAIIASLIIIRVIFGVFGSNSEYYEVTVIGAPENIDLNGYEVLSLEKKGEKTIIHISPKYNEMILLNDLSRSLEGKSRGFFISWNFFSYFGPPKTGIS